ncbi:hypothetical protein D3C84_897250 [compost metagenome]
MLGLDLGTVAVHISDQGTYAAHFRVFIQIPGPDAERMGKHDVVQIRGGNIHPPGMLEAVVQRSADALVLLGQELEIVSILQRPEHRQAVVRRAIVNNDDFEVGVVLGKDALQRSLKVLLGVVARSNDGNQRLRCQWLGERLQMLGGHCG